MSKHLAVDIDRYPSIKAGFTGLTALHSHKFNTRYSGSKKYGVDADGQLYSKKARTKPPAEHNPEKQTRKYSINKRQIRKRLTALINTKKRGQGLWFYTVTFPIKTPNDIRYKVLNSFLTSLRQTSEKVSYLWIAEYQKNGSLHYHIAIDKYYNIKWTNSLVKNLLIYYVRKGQHFTTATALQRYNGVDIAKDRKTRRVVNFANDTKGKALGLYLSKYISKTEATNNRQMWQCSKSVSSLFTELLITSDEVFRLFASCIDINNPIYTDEFSSFFPWIKKPPPEVLHLIRQVNISVLDSVFSKS